MTTTIELKDNECAIVLSDEGSQAYIPDVAKDPDAEAPKVLVLTGALVTAIKNNDPHIQAIIGNFIKQSEEYIHKP